jgi:SMC interacting uncharacterized protein involved in chromosome segregation
MESQYLKKLENENQLLLKRTEEAIKAEQISYETIQRYERKVQLLQSEIDRLTFQNSYKQIRIDKFENNVVSVRHIIQAIDTSKPEEAKTSLDKIIFTGMLDVN